MSMGRSERSSVRAFLIAFTLLLSISVSSAAVGTNVSHDVATVQNDGWTLEIAWQWFHRTLTDVLSGWVLPEPVPNPPVSLEVQSASPSAGLPVGLTGGDDGTGPWPVQ